MPNHKKPTTSPAWSEKDIALLRKEYPLREIAEIAKKLGRSEVAVRLKASKLGIRRGRVLSKEEQKRYREAQSARPEHFPSRYLPPPPPNDLENHRTPWSEQDEALFEQYYTTHGSLYTAAILGRTPGAILAHAHNRAMPGFDTARLERFLEEVGGRLDRVEGVVRKKREKGAPPFVLNGNQQRHVLAELDRRPFDEIAASYGASEEELLFFLVQQGLLPKPYSEPWTMREKKRLRQMWGRRTESEIAAELRRTPFAIRKKAREVVASMQRRPWTKKEDARLRKDYGRIPKRELAEKLGRTTSAVQGRAAHLGLTAKRRKLAVWTKEEDALLRRLQSTHTAVQIAERLPGRTVNAVRARIGNIGAGGRNWQPWQDEKLRRLHGTKPRKEIARILGKTPGAIESRSRRLGLDPLVPNKYFWDRSNDEELVTLSQTMSTRELSEKYGVPPYNIRMQQKRLGVR